MRWDILNKNPNYEVNWNRKSIVKLSNFCIMIRLVEFEMLNAFLHIDWGEQQLLLLIKDEAHIYSDTVIRVWVILFVVNAVGCKLYLSI